MDRQGSVRAQLRCTDKGKRGMKDCICHEMESQRAIYLSSNDASITGIGLLLIELLGKDILQKTSNNTGCAKTTGFFPQTDLKTPLLKGTPIKVIEHGDDKLVSSQSLHPYVLAFFGIGRYSECYHSILHVPQF